MYIFYGGALRLVITGKAREVEQLFESLLRNNTDIKSLVLLSYEGLTMVSTQETGHSNDVLSALAASINDSVPRFVKELKWTSFSDILITGTKDVDKKRVEEYILIKNISGVGLLAALLHSPVNWIKVRSHADYIVYSIKAMDTEQDDFFD